MRLRWLINAALSHPLRVLCVSAVFIATAVFSYRYYAERQLQKQLHEQAEAEVQLHDRLDQIISLHLEDESPLRSWLAEYTQQTQIPVELVKDPASPRPEFPSLGREPGDDPFGGLSTRGGYVSLVGNEDKVNFAARDQPLGEILQQLIGDPAELIWLVKDGHLTVTLPALKFVDQTPGHLYKPLNRGPRQNGCYSTIPVVGMNSLAEVRR